MQVFQAHWTHVMGYFLHAFVVVFEVDAQAQVTPVAVEEVFLATNPTESTSVAVKLLFVFIVVQSADLTEVLAKFNATKVALTEPLHLLFSLAFQTHDARHCFTIQFMGTFLFIMAYPTNVLLLATRGYQSAISVIVSTS